MQINGFSRRGYFTEISTEKPSKERHYDQIAFRTRKDSLSIVKDDAGNESAGVFDYYDVVFRHPTRQECLHATHGLF